MSSTWNGATCREGAARWATMPAGPMRHSQPQKRIEPLTREQIAKLGGVYPPKSRPAPYRPRKLEKRERPRPITTDDIARILAGYEAGKSVTAIAISVKRATSAVRRVLIEHGRDPGRFGNSSPMRIRAVELLRAGKSPEEIAPKIGAALSYVRNIASNVRRVESVERREDA